MSYITIGNATVPALWISVVAALLVLSLLYRKDLQIKALNDAVFTYVLVWKLSYIPLSFSAFIAAPLSVLYFHGGYIGHILGVIVGAVQLYRKRIVDEDFLKVWGKLFAFIFFFQALFVKDMLIVLLGVALFVFWWWKPTMVASVLTAFFLQLATEWNSITVITYVLGVIVIYGLLKYKQQLSSFIVQVLVLSMVAIVMQQTLPEPTKVAGDQRDFTLQSLSGETVSLSDYEGKIVVLNFFATWCPPCKAEMPHLQSFHENSTEDVVLLGVNLTKRDDGIEVLEQFVYDYGVTYPILLDEQDEVGTLYNILSIPTTYILDQQGRVVERIVGPVDNGTLEKITDTLK
ncbi:TlpA family protein disulfide reductase [Lysinibacillus sp. LZ02]|uniref:TlpA family protein disulfide reductase n=1 Tax=Lysinibacillus sp. LZ02 TaxID=3420668 RepID=UPI003D35BA87